MWFRLISILFLVACVWVGAEIYTHGTDGAFGGVFAGLGPAATAGQPATSPLERIQRSASGARDRQLSRIEGQLDGPSVGLRDPRTGQPED